MVTYFICWFFEAVEKTTQLNWMKNVFQIHKKHTSPKFQTPKIWFDLTDGTRQTATRDVAATVLKSFVLFSRYAIHAIWFGILTIGVCNILSLDDIG